MYLFGYINPLWVSTETGQVHCALVEIKDESINVLQILKNIGRIIKVEYTDVETISVVDVFDFKIEKISYLLKEIYSFRKNWEEHRGREVDEDGVGKKTEEIFDAAKKYLPDEKQEPLLVSEIYFALIQLCLLARKEWPANVTLYQNTIKEKLDRSFEINFTMQSYKPIGVMPCVST